VPRRFVAVLCDSEPKPFETGSGRLELADAIASADNPLTARVIVNRVWAAHFGTGIVGTTSNFGQLGDRPTHPRLLDDLTVRFVENGWSLKWLHREIVLSATYRQSSKGQGGRDKGQGDDAGEQSLDPSPLPLTPSFDPSAPSFLTPSRRRLDVEQWRDAVLFATGRLDPSIGGPSIQPQDPDETRRTIYAYVSRLELNPMLATFDFPDPNVHAARRVRTTTPLQKLFVLNSPFMIRQADALVDRLTREAGDDDTDRVRLAYMLLYARPPSENEAALAMTYLTGDDDDDERDERWARYAQVLMAANEMVYLD
jgi:hypothetical protein